MAIYLHLKALLKPLPKKMVTYLLHTHTHTHTPYTHILLNIL